MGERTKYTPGAFSWTDLSTTDPSAAKSFYGSLFGWEAEDVPVGEGMVYSMMRIGGKDVAAISGQPPQQRDAGVPPAWNSYITVESADAAAARAKELGGNVHADAFDVMDVGRGRAARRRRPRGPGLLSWNELATKDMDASAGFYTQLFGWSVEPMEGTEMPYNVIKNTDGQSNGGIRPAQGPEPTYWLNYFGSDDIEAGFAKISELGGSHLLPPTDIGVGKIGIAQDPQGAVFALYSGHFDD